MPDSLAIDQMTHSPAEITPKAEVMDAGITIQIPLSQAADAKAEAEKDRARNYSFKQKNPQSLDVVEVNGTSYVIPAAMGSIYWAILKVCYENVNRPVYFGQLLDGVAQHIQDRNPDDWDDIINKKKTTVHKQSTGVSEAKDTKSWQERIINNAKTLTRWKDYGMRLYELGHVLVFSYDKDVKPCFTLHTNLDALNQPKTVGPRKVRTPKIKATPDVTSEAAPAKKRGRPAKIKK